MNKYQKIRRELKHPENVDKTLAYFWGMFHESHHPSELVTEWAKLHPLYKPKTSVVYVDGMCYHKKKSEHNIPLTIIEETDRKVDALKRVCVGRYYCDLSYKFRKGEYKEVRYTYLPRGQSCWCWCCKANAKYRHHIVMLSRGGTNDPWNIVPICGKCHKRIHPWL